MELQVIQGFVQVFAPSYRETGERRAELTRPSEQRASLVLETQRTQWKHYWVCGVVVWLHVHE